jgi:uncharacterized protein YegP (UPF0339 family)
MAGKFVLSETKNGHYVSVLIAGNGETIAPSETYTTKAAAKNGIDSVKRNAGDADTDDQTDEG